MRIAYRKARSSLQGEVASDGYELQALAAEKVYVQDSFAEHKREVHSWISYRGAAVDVSDRVGEFVRKVRRAIVDVIGEVDGKGK